MGLLHANPVKATAPNVLLILIVLRALKAFIWLAMNANLVLCLIA